MNQIDFLSKQNSELEERENDARIGLQTLKTELETSIAKELESNQNKSALLEQMQHLYTERDTLAMKLGLLEKALASKNAQTEMYKAKTAVVSSFSLQAKMQPDEYVDSLATLKVLCQIHIVLVETHCSKTLQGYLSIDMANL